MLRTRSPARAGPLAFAVRYLLGALAGSLLFTSYLGAQESRRISATIDYVGVEGVYLSVGTAEGVQAGDTLAVFASEADTRPMGSVALTAASRRRSVATMLEPAFPITAGTTVFIDVAATPVDEEPPAQTPPAATDSPTAPAARPLRASTAPRIRGRFSLEVDARETRTSWSGDLFGTTTRRFATPTSSLSLTITDLPGGIRLETSMRGSYRYSDIATLQSTTSMRVYNLAAVKSFEAVPFELRMGRFYNPYESYSAYWDGAMMRLGGRYGPGIGGAVGYEPDRANEGFATDVLKITGFADFAARGRGWRYSTDLSFHSVRPSDVALFDRSFAGWSQQFSLGRTSFSQRVRVDRDATDGTWGLTQMRFRAGIALGGPLRLNAGFGRLRPAALRGLPALEASQRTELTGGLSAIGPAGSVSVDVGSTQWEGDERGISVTAFASRRLGGALLSASGRHWSRNDMTTIAAAPGLSFRWRWLDTRLGYQYYQTRSTATLQSNSGDVSFTARLNGNLSLTLRGQQQWGGSFAGTRLNFRVWRSF